MSETDNNNSEAQPEGAGSETNPGTNSNGQAADESAESAQEGAAPVPMSMEEKLAAVDAQRKEAHERLLRVAADFENWKRRARKEKIDAENKAQENVLRDVLDVIDNLERAVASSATATGVNSVVDGVNLVLRLFQQKLERYQVKAIEAKGQPFDPRQHDAVSRQISPDHAPGTVIDELAKGYTIGDRLLRPATVVVAAPAPVESTEDSAEEDADPVGQGASE